MPVISQEEVDLFRTLVSGPEARERTLAQARVVVERLVAQLDHQARALDQAIASGREVEVIMDADTRRTMIVWHERLSLSPVECLLPWHLAKEIVGQILLAESATQSPLPMTSAKAADVKQKLGAHLIQEAKLEREILKRGVGLSPELHESEDSPRAGFSV